MKPALKWRYDWSMVIGCPSVRQDVELLTQMNSGGIQKAIGDSPMTRA
jgi:hypothetical protein